GRMVALEFPILDSTRSDRDKEGGNQVKKHSGASSVEETAQAFGGLLRQGITAFGSLGGSSVRMIRGAMQTLLPSENCDCEIPTPCWMPQTLGEVTSYVREGGTATIRFQVTNCSMTPRKILVSATPGTPGVKINPPVVNLGPMERRVVAVSLTVAVGESRGEHDVVIWLRGCQEHFLRWSVVVASRVVD